MTFRAPRTLSPLFFALATTVAAVSLGAAGMAAGCGEEVFAPDPDDPGSGTPRAAPTTWSVYLRTEVTGQYLSAQNAGGGAVSAAGALPREWENFSLVDANGDALVDGDYVYLRAHNGTTYLKAQNGGGSTVNVTGAAMNDWEAFQIVRVAGPGNVAIGDKVALRTKLAQRYLTAKDGGGSTVAATATAKNAWEHFVLSGTAPNGPDPRPPTGSQRVVGYLPNWYGSYASWATQVDFSKVTQINLAFALGDSNGNLQLAPDSQVNAFVAAAHAHGVEVFPSLCGGGGDPYIAPHYQPAKVDAFVDKIIAYVVAHDMDGIDVDVEAPNRMGPAYDTFIAKLKAKAAPLGLPVTAAVAPWMQSGMSDTTLRSFDFITVMSYDNTGTWTGAGAHSSYQQALDAIAFYSARGVARDKIVLGVPFYGYCWGNCGGGSTSKYVLYKDILARFSDAWSTDWIDRDGAKLSYNGVATMKAKTTLGNQYGGIMIWELVGDVSSSNSRSLLTAIDTAP